MNNIIAGIVTYNPELERLKENLQAVSMQVSKVVIIDNGSSNIEGIKSCKKLTNQIIIENKENYGVARALNQICEYAYSKGYLWCLTLDQDSVLPHDYINKVKKYLNANVGVIGPNIIYRGNEQYTERKTGLREVEWIITSASVVNVEAWKKINGFDEAMFIDSVDKDFCIRIKSSGYEVLKTYDTYLTHELGKLKCRCMFNHVIYVTNHSAKRVYFMIRNSFYLKKKLNYGNPIIIVSKILIKILLFEDNKMKKIYAIKKGIYDGISSNMENLGGGVLVIMSTYNGETFIRKQLYSLLNQSVPVEILIRDDGSFDNTKMIIKEYVSEHANIHLIEGNNIGVINSFNQLILNPITDNYKWIAFSDQDDVWEINKLHSAIAMLNLNYEDGVPLLYCSNLELVDNSLNHIGYMRSYIPKPDEYKACVQNIASGCTQVFNKEALCLYRKGIGKRMEMHDYWMYLVCLFLGKIIYDKNAYIQYRQHRSNIVGARKRNIKDYIRNIYKYKSSKRCVMLNDFLAVYKEYLTEPQRRVISDFVESQNNLLKRAKVFFSLKYIAYDKTTSLGFKSRVLMGKIY